MLGYTVAGCEKALRILRATHLETPLRRSEGAVFYVLVFPALVILTLALALNSKFTLVIYHDKTTDRELYLARTTDKKVIAVKFSRCYSFELHAFCALLGFERLPGGFFCVAMEFVVAACRLTQSPYVVKRGGWVRQLRELVDAFHAQDLVHGDLWGPNVICDGNRITIIDFDWAGKLGEVSYPDNPLNPELTDGRDSSDREIIKGDDLGLLRASGWMCRSMVRSKNVKKCLL